MNGTSLTSNNGQLLVGGQMIQQKNPFPASGLSLGGLPIAPSGSNINLTGLPQAPSIAPSSTGGISFPSTLYSGYKGSSNISPTSKVSPAPTGNLSDYIINTSQTPSGGSLSTTANGTPTGYNPNSGFSIDTSGAVPSSALSQNTSQNDLSQQHSQYMDYVQALAQAQGYSPQYIQALQGQYGAQTQGAELNLNSAALNSNLYTGNNLPGDTMNYAQGATAKAQAQNTLQEAQNSIQQLGANQALNTAQLQRTGNIASAQAELQYNPVAVSGENALSQYNALQQQYPSANIPAYNPSISPAANQQLAQQAVAQSPAYQAQFQSTYQTPGGGLSTYSKLDPSGGGSELVSGAAAATGSSDAASLTQQQQYLDTTNRAYQTATSNLGTLQKFMQQNNLNDSTLPILNQIENKVKAGVLSPGVVAAYQSSVAGLRSEYAQVLSRGGAVTDTERNEALTLIPDDLSPSQLQVVTQQLSTEGSNAIKESQAQIDTIKSRLGGGSTSTTSNGWY